MSDKCEYVYIGGMRVPMENVLITFVPWNQRSAMTQSFRVVGASRGRDRGDPPYIQTISELKKLLKNNYNSKMVVNVYDPKTKSSVGEPFEFNPSKAQGRFEELFKSSLRWLFVAAGIAIVTASVHLFNNTGSSDAIQLLGPQLTSEDNTQTSEATSARMSAQSTTPLAGQSTHFREVDSWDRAAIVAAYNAEFFRIEPPMGFTGAVASCTAGTTNPEYRASVIQRVNWYRVMAGLQPVAEKTQYSEANQQAAVMMSNNGRLSHYPDATWKCHTEEGEISSGRSSLALGIAGVGAIDAYIADFGDNNREVGHRRTILYPQTQLVGTGDVPGSEGFYPSNTLQGFDSKIWSRRPEVPEARDFVAWPPSGYVPPETVWTRWSFSLPESNFSNANVAVKGPNGAVQAEVIARVQSKGRSAPESSIVWSMNGTTDSVPFTPVPTGGHDDCYDVTISGVMTNDGNTLAPFEYTNCILDMSLPATGAAASSSRAASSSSRSRAVLAAPRGDD